MFGEKIIAHCERLDGGIAVKLKISCMTDKPLIFDDNEYEEFKRHFEDKIEFFFIGDE